MSPRCRPAPPITVTQNGSSFDEFLAKGGAGQIGLEELPGRYVLFVATVEGRKNHRLMLDVWRRMVETGDDPPYLVCVGRLGWKSEAFLAELVESDYLNGKVILLQDVSDADLGLLYSRCLFTVCPSLYEGWGCRSASHWPPARYACAVIAPQSRRSPASSAHTSISAISNNHSKRSGV